MDGGSVGSKAFKRDDKNKKEGKQCTYKVILLRVRVTAVATEMQECLPFVSLTLRQLLTERTNVFIHIILQSSTCFEHYCAHLQEVQFYTYSIWYRHSLNQFNVRPLTESDGTRCCTYTIEPPEDEHNNARNM